MLFVKDFEVRPKSPRLPVFQTVTKFLLPCIPQFPNRWKRESIWDAADMQQKLFSHQYLYHPKIIWLQYIAFKTPL